MEMTKTIRYNEAVKGLPDEIKVSDLKANPGDYHARQLRNIVVSYGIGDAKWRNLAPKDELIKALEDNFPNGVIKVLKAGDEVVKTEGAPAKPKAEAPVPVNTLPGLFIPNEDESFVFNDNLRSYLSALRRMSQGSTDIMNTLLVGPQGCGKTSVAYEFAAKTKMPLLKMNCPLVREPRDWFGAKRAENGSVFWDKALFAEAIAQGGLVVLLDEITRATPNVLNSLLPLLDWTRESYVEEAKEKLKVGPKTYFFATANIGAQFTGTFKLDSALADRFGAIVECSFLPAQEEAELLVKRSGISPDVAGRLVKVANMVRNENQNSGKLTETISTRVLLDVARLYIPLKETAFRFTVLPKFSADGGKQSERAQVLGFIQGQFPNLVL
jgi:Holliday junction resolvasome RuvABC ATP-dependent DNA helicase subunit